jgi:hypothetical protein
MGVLKGLGYVVAAVLVVSVLGALSTLIAAIVAIAGLLFYGAIVVGFVAYCIKEYCEAEPDRLETGEQERERKTS